MGIVHNNSVGLPCLHQLEASGNTIKAIQNTNNNLLANALCQHSAHCTHHIIHIEFAGNL